MATKVFASTSIQPGKFRGCLAGVLLGDCLGAPFEGQECVSVSLLAQRFREWSDNDSRKKRLKYTDDTACTRAVAASLIEQKAFDPRDTARRLTEEYFRQPDRGYGSNVIKVFDRLRNEDYRDPFGPSLEQFGGKGSYGNGAAMRAAPVALLLSQRPEAMLETAETCARLTHAHPLGYGGAVLQSLAVARVLNQNEILNPAELVEELRTEMEQREESDKTLTRKLERVGQLINQPQLPAIPEVVSLLGHGLSAAESVPTALYCFLRGLTPLEEWPSDNGLERTLFYAISLGGDTDTIASMAGAIAGAYYGWQKVPNRLLDYCEDSDSILDMADRLHQLSLD